MKKKLKADKAAPYDGTWWQAEDEQQLAQAAVSLIAAWKDQHAARLNEYRTITQQYAGAKGVGVQSNDYETAGRHSVKLRYNLLSAIIDTYVARRVADRPRPVVLTEQGRWRQRKMARELSKLLLGVLLNSRAYEDAPAVERDRALFGLGAYKVVVNPQSKDFEIERVFPGELLWDLDEGYRGSITELAHIVDVPKTTVQALYPHKRMELSEVTPKSASKAQRAGSKTRSPMVELVELWRLSPVPPREADGETEGECGRHVIMCGNCVLVDEKWHFDSFPFALEPFKAAVRGISGESLASQVVGLHLSLNKHLENMDDALSDGARHRAWVNRSAHVSIRKLESEFGITAIHEYDGEKPIFETPVVLSPDWVDHSRWLASSGYDVAGISQLSASGRKPVGLDAGVAIREQQDIEDSRFVPQQAGFDRLFVKIAQLVVKMGKHYWSEGKTVKVPVRGKRAIERIKWENIDLDPDLYDISVFPSSMLPRTPSGRLNTLADWEQRQWVSKGTAMRLADFPDLEEESSLATAALDDIDDTIDRMLFDEPTAEEMDFPDVQDAIAAAERQPTAELKAAALDLVAANLVYSAPEPMQNLAEGIARMESVYLRERLSDLPRARLDLLTRWIADANEMIKQMQVAAGSMTGGMSGGMMPQGMQPPMMVPDGQGAGSMVPVSQGGQQ